MTRTRRNTVEQRLRSVVVATMASGVFLLALSAGVADAQTKQKGAGAERRAPRMPVLVYVFNHTEDHTNIDLSEERFWRTLPMVERIRKEFPDCGISYSVQFYGADSQVFSDRNSQTGLIDFILRYRDRGLIEPGYHGAHEPAYNRPRPNLEDARTPEERWLAYGKATDDFLSQYKDLLTGEPDPRRPGGLVKTMQVFGAMNCISGVGTSPVATHWLNKYTQGFNQFGFPDHGPGSGDAYRARLRAFEEVLSPSSACCPEMFWMNGSLHLSDGDGQSTGVEAGFLGPEAIQHRLNLVDHTKVHKVQVMLSNKYTYIKTWLGLSPTRYAYSHPDAPALPASDLRTRLEINEMYDLQEKLLRHLAENYFPQNPGSRFVSNADLKRMFKTSNGGDLPQSKVVSAARALLKNWEGNKPPVFVEAEGEYLALTDCFDLFCKALADTARSQTLPASVPLSNLYGPIYYPDPSKSSQSVDVETVVKACRELRPKLEAKKWEPLPKNIVPGTMKLSETQSLNSAEFLYAMASACVALAEGKTGEKLAVQPATMLPRTAEMMPTFTGTDEFAGQAWTLKPAALSAEYIPESVNS